MEYIYDLGKWADQGYGSELNAALSQPLLEDMVQKFSNSDQEATFYFSHAEAVLPLLSLLQINKDDFELTSQTFSRDRLYRTSLMAPFAGNIGFGLYNCTGYPGSPFVIAFANGGTLPLPKCPSPCSFEDFVHAYLVKLDSTAYVYIGCAKPDVVLGLSTDKCTFPAFFGFPGPYLWLQQYLCSLMEILDRVRRSFGDGANEEFPRNRKRFSTLLHGISI